MYTWKLAGGEVFRPLPFGIMGIVNLTPDSFFDGGEYAKTEKALAHALQLWQEGAHILDLGAESSRPGATAVKPHEELERLLPTLTQLLHIRKNTKKPQPPYISIDTYHADTAKKALELGAHIINDISACLFDPKLLDIVAQYKPGYVLMHSKARPSTMQNDLHYDNILEDIYNFFEERMHALMDAGLPKEHIVIDPGIGFGKSLEQNLYILQNIHVFAKLGRPILMGLSMKSFIHGLLELSKEHVQEKTQGTQILTALLANKGIALHRVHHVAESVRTLKLVTALDTMEHKEGTC